MLISDALRMPLIVLVPVLHWTGHLGFGGLVAIVFLIGAFTAPYISAQRVIIPELFGDDEKTVGKANGLLGGANQLPIVIGPAIAGVLIALFGAPAILVVDGGTFLFAFVVVLSLVKAGRRVPIDEEHRGVLAGVRYLAKDKLLGPMSLTLVLLDGASGAIAVAVPLLAFSRYHRDPHIAGWIFTSFGIGAIFGSLLVVKLLDRIQPLRLASVGVVCATLPLWIVALNVSWPVACAAVVACGVFVPSVNAPFMGLLTTRPPAALRARVMTAVLTVSGLGSPLGRLAVGPVYRAAGNAGVWVLIAGGLSVGSVLFVAAAIRGSAGDAADVARVAPVAHGEL
jgi:predicted MFS family arabinose efflux permease